MGAVMFQQTGKILKVRQAGFIPVDSIYSPVLKVKSAASHQRVKERMNFDRLIMEIYTNGAVEPSIVLFLAAKILKDMAAKISLFEIEPQYSGYRIRPRVGRKRTHSENKCEGN